MSSRLRHVCIAIAIVALAMLSHGRLMRAGWLGGDLAVLRYAQAVVAVTDEGDNGRAGWLDFGRIRPVPGVVLVAHERLFGQHGPFAPIHARSLRAFSFILLLATAAAAGFALRRALLPWIGGDTARAAGFALALFFATHPLGTAFVARPAALGDLFALFFSSLAASLFLRGRQQREKQWVMLAGVCAVLAGFSSSMALLLPVMLAGLELGSAQRPRPFLARVRTAATTLVVFLGCVLLESVCAALLRQPGLDLDLPAWDAAAGALAAGVEKLGILFLPVPGESPRLPSQWPSYLLSVALVLLASWPVLRSARAAPRLWGWLGIAWLLALALALLPHAAVRVAPGDYSHAEILAAPTLFACAGLAVASTALLGTRRILLPAAIAIGFAWLGAQAARSFDHASQAIDVLREDLERARAAGGLHAHVLVVDPPARAAGMDLGVEWLRLLSDPPSRGEALGHEPRAIQREALGLLSRTGDFAAWRKAGVVLVAPHGALDDEPGRPDPSARRDVRVVPPATGMQPPVQWKASNVSALFESDLDSGATHSARFTGQAGTSTAEAPRIVWRVSEPEGETFSAIGVWLAGETETAPVAVFDLARSSDWWMAPSVRRVYTDDPFVHVATAELLADVRLDLEDAGPIVRGDDWRFLIPRASLPRLLRGEDRYVLELLDLDTLTFARIAAEESTSAGFLVLEAPGAAGFERSMRSTDDEVRTRLAWSLDRRVGGATIARASGRR